MSNLRDQLRAVRVHGPVEPWSEVSRELGELVARRSNQKHMATVISFAMPALKGRVLGRIERGLMASLFGPVLVTEFEQPHWKPHPVSVTNITGCAAVLHLDGVDLSNRALATLAERLRDARQPDDMPLYPMLRGLCGIYFGFDDVWQAEADVPWTDAYAFVPGRTFGGNVKGLMVYLGAARLAGAAFEDVEPAVLDFIHLFDGLQDAGFVFFKHLVLVCIIAGHSIGGVPREETLDWVGRYICWAVGLDEEKPALPAAGA